jgi:TatD DNase family protein
MVVDFNLQEKRENFMLIDSHCHIEGEEFEPDREEVIERAKKAGVIAMLNVGTGSPSSNSFEKTVELANKHDFIFASVGIHPHDAKEYDEKVEKKLIALVESNEKVIAWGEIGLDFHYNHSPHEKQKEVFRRQIRVALDLKMPIIVHSRNADEDTLKILLEECPNENFRGGIMHCFGGSAEMAKILLENGFLISFAGNITFRKAENLRQAAKVVPLEKLLTETDSPYLAPVPMRGKRNEPAFVIYTAKFLADLYEVDFETLAKQTTKNFLQFFVSQNRSKTLFENLLSSL